MEDEPALRELFRLTLAAQGYRVIEASDGESAQRAEESHEGPLHLLLTDVVMPRLSGRELALGLRAKRPGLRVLFRSGYTEDAVIRHGALEPGSAFLQKPFTPAGLARRVREILDQSEPAR